MSVYKTTNVVSNIAYCLSDDVSVLMERITGSRNLSYKTSQEVDDLPFSNTEKVRKTFKKNEKVEGLWGIKNLTFERESFKKTT